MYELTSKKIINFKRPRTLSNHELHCTNDTIKDEDHPSIDHHVGHKMITDQDHPSIHLMNWYLVFLLNANKTVYFLSMWLVLRNLSWDKKKKKILMAPWNFTNYVHENSLVLKYNSTPLLMLFSFSFAPIESTQEKETPQHKLQT